MALFSFLGFFLCPVQLFFDGLRRIPPSQRDQPQRRPEPEREWAPLLSAERRTKKSPGGGGGGSNRSGGSSKSLLGLGASQETGAGEGGEVDPG